MKIENNAVVRFHYSVAEAGQPGTDLSEMENSRAGEPLAILIGHGNIVPGLEAAMLGREAGERFEVTLAPEQAYGERRDGMIQRVAKKLFPKGVALKPGVQVTLKTNQGPRMVTVHKVGASVVDVDLNHPMAGRTLAFAIEVVEVRAASDEEIAHRHVHGDGGHAH
jgi:FKBP-type peptidyl-prolyl cis-trans isomerase SlyD